MQPCGIIKQFCVVVMQPCAVVVQPCAVIMQPCAAVMQFWVAIMHPCAAIMQPCAAIAQPCASQVSHEIRTPQKRCQKRNSFLQQHCICAFARLLQPALLEFSVAVYVQTVCHPQKSPKFQWMEVSFLVVKVVRL